MREREKRVKNMDKTKCQTTTAALPQRCQALATLAYNAIEDRGSAAAELRVLCFEYSFIKSSTLCAVCGLSCNNNGKITNVIRRTNMQINEIFKINKRKQTILPARKQIKAVCKQNLPIRTFTIRLECTSTLVGAVLLYCMR